MSVSGATIDTSNKEIGAGSGLFASGQYVTTPSSTDLLLPYTEDFTIEAWVYPTGWNSSFNTIVSKGAQDANREWAMGISASGLGFYRLLTGEDFSSSTMNFKTASIPLNTWTHVALVFTSGVVNFYVNGVNVGTDSSLTGAYSGSDQPVTVGEFMGYPGAGLGMIGNIDELRISNGLARYTSTFTPSTTAFTSDGNTALLLHMDS
jgi:MSHA biogenesis protein MshQ